MKNLFRLIYISEIDALSFNSQDLQDILFTARKNNGQNHITGVLIFDYSHFLQVLEGDNEIISDTFLKIARDTRHRHLRIVSAYNAERRYFENWDMEFKELNDIVEHGTTKICEMSIEDIEAIIKKLQKANA